MRLTRILTLGPSTLTVFRFCRGRVCEAFAFDDTESGRTAFARYLAEDGCVPTGLLVDRPEEEFRVDTVPHVVTDRSALLARHGARLFRTTPFRCAIVLGREARGRRDDRVLFSAIGHEALQPWLDCLARAQIPLAVITSVAYVSARLVTHLHAKGAIVLAAIGADGGLRQTVFIDGELRFSRLSVPPASADMPSFAAEQIGRTAQYVQRLGSTTDVSHMEIHLLAAAGLTGLDAAAGPYAVHVHALPDVARAAGCTEYAGRDVRVLFAELAARGKANRYALSPEHRRHYVRSRVAYGARIGIWGVAFGAALAALQNVAAATVAFEAAESARRQLEQVRARETPGDELIAEAARVREAVARADRLLAGRNPLPAVFEPTGAVLARFPEFRLDSLTVADVPEPGAHEDAALSSGPLGAYHSVWLRGQVVGFEKDRRRAGQRFDELVIALKNLPTAASVQVIEHPFDVQGPIAGGAGDRGSSPAPRFGVQLTVTAS